MTAQFLYVFLDESGNFDFSPKGSRFFLFTSVTKERPFEAFKALHDLRYDLLEEGVEIGECFHATEDRQMVRDRVFEVIRQNLAGVEIDSLFVEKRKTGPALRPVERFYPEMLGYLLRHVLKSRNLSKYKEVLVFLATLHTGKQRAAMEKSVKQTLAAKLPKGAKYRIIYHPAKANFDIQIADYCTWAVFKSLMGEHRPLAIIKPAIRSTFDIFRSGTHYYY